MRDMVSETYSTAFVVLVGPWQPAELLRPMCNADAVRV